MAIPSITDQVKACLSADYPHGVHLDWTQLQWVFGIIERKRTPWPNTELRESINGQLLATGDSAVLVFSESECEAFKSLLNHPKFNQGDTPSVAKSILDKIV